MKTSRAKKFVICAIIFAVGILLDQVTKHLTVLFILPRGEDLTVWKGVLNLTYCENTGAAFSMMSSATVFLAIGTAVVIAIIALVIILDKHSRPLLHYSLAAIAAGGAGNLIDRVIHGYVVDMIDFKLLKMPSVSFNPFAVELSDFAIFNIADTFVTIGTILFLICIIFVKEEPVWKTANSVKTEDEDY